VQPLKNFPAFHGTRKFNTVFTKALHWSLSWAISIQSTPSHRTSLILCVVCVITVCFSVFYYIGYVFYCFGYVLLYAYCIGHKLLYVCVLLCCVVYVLLYCV
jgi:energy-coupling factor transporter transmembrane protein EcfT